MTELVAKVVDHSGSDANFTLELTLSDRWLRISLFNGWSVKPILRELSRERPRRRRLFMVQAIADRLGSE